jgi:aarF domain-containing kinase
MELLLAPRYLLNRFRAIIPREWAETFRPLQDNCEPTAYEDVVRLLELEMGRNLQDLFEYFEPRPIGVASLAQVHVAKYLGREVAVKLQHPALDEFTKIDIKTVGILVGTLFFSHWQACS